MHYLYKILFIIWIPILLRIFLYIVYSWAKDFKEEILEVFDVLDCTVIDRKKKYTMKQKPGTQLKYSKNQYDYLFTATLNIHTLYQLIYNGAKHSRISKLLLTIIYILYLITWIYILIKVLAV